MKSITSFINIFLLAILISTAGFAQKAVPSLGGYMIHDDEAHVLSSNDKAMLEYAVKAEADSTSNQIAVLVINSLEGDDIDSYAHRVFNEWKLFSSLSLYRIVLCASNQVAASKVFSPMHNPVVSIETRLHLTSAGAPTAMV